MFGSAKIYCVSLATKPPQINMPITENSYITIRITESSDEIGSARFLNVSNTFRIVFVS